MWLGCVRHQSKLRRPRKSALSSAVAIVTPSYRLDFERCALLNRSLQACAPSFEHWIVVDRGDIPLFRRLESRRTTVVAKEEVLPVWVHRVDTLKLGLRSNVWIQSRGRPIRGWLLQQLVKLAVAEHLDTDVVVHADSDVVFLRPFSVSSVIDARGRVRLYQRPDCVDQSLAGHVRWHRSAERLLGIDAADVPMPDFISSLVPWRRENAVALLEHLERTTGRHWLRAVAAAWDVSEYTLYGRFARDVLGDGAAQFVSTSPLCVDYYKRVALTAPELTAFLESVDDDAVAVSLTAKAGMKPDDYMQVLERHWGTPVPQKPARDVAWSPRRSRGPRPAPARRKETVGVRSRTGRRRGAARPTRLPTRSGLTVVIGAIVAMMMILLEAGFD